MLFSSKLKLRSKSLWITSWFSCSYMRKGPQWVLYYIIQYLPRNFLRILCAFAEFPCEMSCNYSTLLRNLLLFLYLGRVSIFCGLSHPHILMKFSTPYVRGIEQERALHCLFRSFEQYRRRTTEVPRLTQHSVGGLQNGVWKDVGYDMRNNVRNSCLCMERRWCDVAGTRGVPIISRKEHALQSWGCTFHAQASALFLVLYKQDKF